MSQTKPVQDSRPVDRVSERIATRAGITTAELTQRIERIRQGTEDSDAHLTYLEAVDVDRLAVDREAHLMQCAYCRRLVDCVNPSTDILDTLLGRVGKTQPAPAEDRMEIEAPTESVATIRNFSFSMVAAAALLFGLGWWLTSAQPKYELSQQAKLLERLADLQTVLATAEGDKRLQAQWETARLHVALREPERSSVYLTKALVEMGANAATVSTFVDVTSSDELAAYEDRYQAVLELINARKRSDPESLVRAAKLQWQVGRPIDAYELLGTYLAKAESNSNIVTVYQSEFLAALED